MGDTFDPMAAIETLAGRFAGLTLESRRVGTDWPEQWRCRIQPNKGERQNYATVQFGADARDAIERCARFVYEEDSKVSKGPRMAGFPHG